VRIPRQLVVAGLTVITVGSLTSTFLPSQANVSNSDRAQREYQLEYPDAASGPANAARVRATTLQDAINSDELTPAELRAQEAADSAIARALVERP
jgi:hypothetical protein